MFDFNLIVIGFILLFAIIGLKRGVIKEVVSFAEMFLAYVVAFLFKGPISIFLYQKLPFFSFDGLFKGVSVINILIYEVIAFALLLVVVFIIFKILKFVSTIIEKILTATVILGIPSKILGGVVGLAQGYFIAFIILFILSLPIINIEMVNESSIADFIVNDTPFLSTVNEPIIKTFDEIYSLKDKYENIDEKDEFNKEALTILLTYKIVSEESIDYLLESGKLKIDGVESSSDIFLKEEEIEDEI